MSAINLTVTSVNGVDVSSYTETFTISNIITAFTKAAGDTSYTAVSVVTYRGANGRIDNFGVSESISTIRAGLSEYDIACTVTELRGGTNNIDFVSALTLADQGFVFGAGTYGFTGTYTVTGSQNIVKSAAGVALSITATATTARIVDITTTVADTSLNLTNVAVTMSTPFSTAKTLKGTNYSLTSGATDVDASGYIAHDVALVSTALSKADMTGYKVVISGTGSGGAGTQDYIGFNVIPTITLNSVGTSNLYGVNIDFTGITTTACNDVYGIRIVTTQAAGQTSDACAYMADGNTSVYICDNTYAVYTAKGAAITTLNGANAVDLTGTFAGHGIYVHGATFASGKRALRIGDYGTEIALTGGEGIIRSYAKTTSGTGATALQFHWGFNTVAAVDLIGYQEQFESQVAAVGSETLMGRDTIVGIAAAGFMATTAGSMTKGLIGGRYKVYADVTSTCAGSVAALWLDNQMNCAVTETECSIRSSTGGSVPDAWALFTTTSAGWANLFAFDATMAGVAPKDTSFTGNAGFASNNLGTFTLAGGLKILDGATQYWIPYGVLSN